MLSSAECTGCYPCSVLSEGILKFFADDGEVTREDVDQLRIDFNMAGTKRSLEVTLLNTPIELWFFRSEGKLDCHKQQLHKSCEAYSDSLLPRRVLDVFAEGESGVRLYESNGEKAPYVCLSHCWGFKPFLRTLSGNLDVHNDEIIWSRLPQTFQDAIKFTRKLGIRYLWIDSLCIIPR
ncbi:hypothetical protein VTK56DRAFT_8898 [Thermocarpiscus australiensis]